MEAVKPVQSIATTIPLMVGALLIVRALTKPINKASVYVLQDFTVSMEHVSPVHQQLFIIPLHSDVKQNVRTINNLLTEFVSACLVITSLMESANHVHTHRCSTTENVSHAL